MFFVQKVGSDVNNGGVLKSCVAWLECAFYFAGHLEAVVFS